jgi:hypothetical protein
LKRNISIDPLPVKPDVSFLLQIKIADMKTKSGDGGVESNQEAVSGSPGHNFMISPVLSLFSFKNDFFCLVLKRESAGWYRGKKVKKIWEQAENNN